MYLSVDPTKAREFAEKLNDLSSDLQDASTELALIRERINSDKHDYMCKRGFGDNLLTTAVYIDYRYEAFRDIVKGLEYLADKVSTSENKVIRSLKTKTQT